MKNGDVYFWRWKDEDRHRDCGPFRSYHCKSQIATVKGGVAYDTFWNDHRHPLNLDIVEVKYQGNTNEMGVIQVYDLPYYRKEDIVDLRHSNSTSAEIYLKADAVRDPDTMREYIKYQIQERWSAITSAQNTIDRLNEAAAQIDAGELDEVYL